MTSSRWPRYGAAAVGFLWFLRLGGRATLNPANADWVMAGDWLQHWLGWLFFRNDPWTFPLGRISSLPYPVGTTIGFTDSNPLMSLLLKPFSNLLPPDMQFIGPWFALCFVLQGYMGAALASTVTERRWQQFLGGVLIVLSPALVARLGHDTLCAHWLLIGLMYLGLRSYADDAAVRRAVWLTGGAAAMAAAIHPYLAAMCWVMAQAVFMRLWRDRRRTLLATAVAAAGTTAAVLAVFAVIGYFGTKAQLGTQGYGAFSSDLLTLFLPMGHSRFLPTWDLGNAQWEGLAYLGLGGIALLAVALAAVVARRPTTSGRHVWPVITVCVLLALYAFSTVLTVFGHEVLRLDWLTPKNTPYRASGRFIWAFHYLLLLAGIWGVTRIVPRHRQSIATALLAAAVVLQAADVTVDPFWLGRKDFKQARLFNFRLAAGHYHHLALFPAQVLFIGPGPYEEDLAYRYMLLAHKLNMTYNSGIFARTDATRLRQSAGWMFSAVSSGLVDRDTVYVVSPQFVGTFREANASCGQFDDDWVCVSRDSYEPFRSYVDAHSQPTPPAQ